MAFCAIAAGYVLLVWTFGWAGVAVAVLHVAVMLAARRG
jgi:hypothetical protein